jgi:phosphatidylglycerophosphate synthase
VLDRWTLRLVKKPLSKGAFFLHHVGVKADQITLSGFVVGIFCLPALTMKWYWIALVCIVFNRVADGLDGEVARLAGPTESGAFLDIVLDFIFYGAVVFGFALAEPGKNSLAAAALLFSFIGTGSSFLAFAIMAERRGIEKIVYPNKGIYYLAGLAEGTETILFLVLFCLFPDSFVQLAYCFVSICLVTVLTRVAGGYFTLKKRMFMDEE